MSPIAYQDLLLLQSLGTGDVLTAATMTQVRLNDEYLVDPPAVSVYNSVGQTVASTVDASMDADSELFDNDSMHSTTTDTSRITVQTAGRYLFLMTVAWPANSTGYRLLGLRRDGTTTDNVATVPAAPSVPTLISGSKMLTMTAGSYVECRTRHTAGVDLAVELREFAAYFLTR